MDGQLQWGHGACAVEAGQLAGAAHFPVAASMGPRRLRRGSLLQLLANMLGRGQLQWGHGACAVEAKPAVGQLAKHGVASMGPRRLRRGSPSSANRAAWCCTGFNGATAL